MKRARFSEKKIIATLREQEAGTTATGSRIASRMAMSPAQTLKCANRHRQDRLAWIARNRPLACNFKRYARTVASFVRLAMIRIMLRRLTRTIPCS